MGRVDAGRSAKVPRWLWAVWLVLVAIVVTTRYVIDMGDSGLTNVLTALPVLLGGVVTFLWFTLRSAASGRTRLTTALVTVGLVVGFGTLFRFDGVDGQMRPLFVLRSAATDVAVAPAVAGGAAGPLVASANDFPGFLGPQRDLRVHGVEIDADWQSHPPELLWRREIGAGWSGFAVVNGHAATLEQREDTEMVSLYSLQDGELVWTYELPGSGFSHPLGGVGPRSTPTIDGGIVYAQGVHGYLVALDGASGQPLWERDLLADYGITEEEEVADVGYGRSGSPLAFGDALFVPVGGSRRQRVSLAAYDKRTGERLWEGGTHNVSMSSPAVGLLLDEAQILIVNEGAVSGHDPRTGLQRWEFEWPGMTAGDSSASQAVAVPPDQVFVSKGYGQGAALYRLTGSAQNGVEVEQVWHRPRSLRTKLTNVAIKDGYVYGLSEGILECVDLATGERQWKAGRYHHGQILMVGQQLLVLTEDGEIVLVQASPMQKNNVLGRFQALEGHTWNNFAVSGDVLLVRNAREAAAWRLPLQ